MYKKGSIERLIQLAKKANRDTVNHEEELEIKKLIKKLESYKK